MRWIRLLFGVSAVIALCSGCEFITGVDDLEKCDGPPEVRIETGDEVWFRWGKCTVDELAVINEQLMGIWVVQGEVRGPVKYGVAKKNWNVEIGPEPLQPGANYKVVVSLLIEEGVETESFEFTR